MQSKTQESADRVGQHNAGAGALQSVMNSMYKLVGRKDKASFLSKMHKMVEKGDKACLAMRESLLAKWREPEAMPRAKSGAQDKDGDKADPGTLIKTAATIMECLQGLFEGTSYLLAISLFVGCFLMGLLLHGLGEFLESYSERPAPTIKPLQASRLWNRRMSDPSSASLQRSLSPPPLCTKRRMSEPCDVSRTASGYIEASWKD